MARSKFSQCVALFAPIRVPSRRPNSSATADSCFHTSFTKGDHFSFVRSVLQTRQNDTHRTMAMPPKTTAESSVRSHDEATTYQEQQLLSLRQALSASMLYDGRPVPVPTSPHEHQQWLVDILDAVLVMAQEIESLTTASHHEESR